MLKNYNLTGQLACNSSAIVNDNASFISGLIQERGQLSNNPGFEIHPYKKSFLLQEFEKYIIGTFPPISYILDDPQIIAENLVNLRQPHGAGGRVIMPPWIPFYHGNQGSLWDFLLTTAERNNLLAIRKTFNGRENTKNYLIDFLIQNRINYADIIDCTRRKLNTKGRYDGKDKSLNNICPNNDLIYHLLSSAKAKYLLFNSSSTFGKEGIRIKNGLVDISTNTKSFDLFVRQCQNLGLIVEAQVQKGDPSTFFMWTNVSALRDLQRRKKLVFEIKITNTSGNNNFICDNFPCGSEKKFTVVTGPSPSSIARLGLNRNAICNNWLTANPGQTRGDFIQWVYQSFRSNSFAQLYEMNV